MLVLNYLGPSKYSLHFPVKSSHTKQEVRRGGEFGEGELFPRFLDRLAAGSQTFYTP